jgi:hypothetical protein
LAGWLNGDGGKSGAKVGLVKRRDLQARRHRIGSQPAERQLVCSSKQDEGA